MGDPATLILHPRIFGFSSSLLHIMDAILLWLIIFFITILSLSNVIIIISKIIQVFNGSSVLDYDAPIGMKVRKWFLIFLSSSNLLRFLFSVFFIIYWIRISYWYHETGGNEENEKGKSAIISELHPEASSLKSLKSSFRGVLEREEDYSSSIESIGNNTVFWLVYQIPSLYFLLLFTFLTNYLGEVYLSLSGCEPERRNLFRWTWIILNVLIFISILTWIIYTFNSFHDKKEDYFLSLSWNFCFLSLFSALLTIIFIFFSIKVIRYLQHSSYSNPTKIIARLLVIASILSLIIFYLFVSRMVEFAYYSPLRR
jgi:hypothetical protein